jgi:DNA-directed RNA polymerase specialized sigma24 family protein
MGEISGKPADAVAELHCRVAGRPPPAGPPDRELPSAADHDDVPENRLLLSELSCLTRQAIEELPPRERAVRACLDPYLMLERT